MSTIQATLDAHLGKPIDQICPNRFHDYGSNHCAHFVSHALDLRFSYQCREFKGGNKRPGNIRVQEIFAQCPKVGKFADAPTDRPVLAFVTRKNVVDIANKKMGNIPQKHIGVHVDGHIYHYSNTQEKVVKWTVNKFFNQFQSSYSGDQGLYFGTIPGSDLVLNIQPTGQNVPEGIPFELTRNGKKWYAQAKSIPNEPKFYVGRTVSQTTKKYWGIYQKATEYYGTKFYGNDYADTIDHWANLLHVTGFCESGNFFNLINTYDRAKFTFGFYQLAAHTPHDNLILLFREAMKLGRAKEYFPELKMIDGELHRINHDGATTNLETVMNTGPNGRPQLQLFMNYMNPRRKKIDEQEVLQCARLMHWMTNDKFFRDAYVAVSNEILQKKISRRYHVWYDLHGQSDIICALIADIHHQGRAKKSRVRAALNSTNPRKRLIDINSNYLSRNKSLKEIIDNLESSGILGQKTYDAANNEFV